MIVVTLFDDGRRYIIMELDDDGKNAREVTGEFCLVPMQMETHDGPQEGFFFGRKPEGGEDGQ